MAWILGEIMIKVSRILRRAAQIELGEPYRKPQQQAPQGDVWGADKEVKKDDAHRQKMQDSQESQRKQELAAKAADYLKTVNTGGHTVKELVTDPRFVQFKARLFSGLKQVLEGTGKFKPAVDNVTDLVLGILNHRSSRMIKVSRILRDKSQSNP